MNHSPRREDLDAVLGAIDGLVQADLPTSSDAMRWAPSAPEPVPSAVRGLLIPFDCEEPIQTIDLDPDADGGLLAELVPHLGSRVDAAPGLSNLDFVTNDDGRYVTESRYLNTRATIIRTTLWNAVIDGHYAVSDADLQLAQDMLATDHRYLQLFGPVVVLGANPQTRAWVSVPERLANTLLSLDSLIRHNTVIVIGP